MSDPKPPVYAVDPREMHGPKIEKTLHDMNASSWADLTAHAESLKAHTLAMDDLSVALKANTSAVDIARDTMTELITAIDRLADLLSQKPA